MTHQKYLTVFLLAALFGTSACTQTTPSMMNSQPMTVSEEALIDQIPLRNINESSLNAMADYYLKNSSGPLDLTLTYDPNSKSFGPNSARHELGHIVSKLKSKGVRNISSTVMAAPNMDPFLIVTYSSAVANAPSDCGETPGLNDYQTGRFLGEYKFGCGVESMFAKQISDPNDLYGRSGLGPRDARRDANVIEGYSSGAEAPPLQGIETNERLGG